MALLSSAGRQFERQGEKVPLLQRFRENWVRPALFFGNNPISLAGGAITSASGVTMIGYWLVELFGRPNDNPYLGIIFFLLLPALFIAGLALIPVGVYLRRKMLQKAGQIPVEFPKVDFNDRIFRHGVDIVLVATIVNLLVVAMASYRGAAYMDSPQFCGQSCHVMHPEYTAYQISAHSHVACVDCHIGSGASSYFAAKVNGTKQLIEVAFDRYPTPIPSPVQNLRPARDICEGCHTPARFIGEKLLVKSSFADDEKNSETQTVVVLHLGGRDSLSHLTGIHGVHLGHIEYVDHRSHAHDDSLGAKAERGRLHDGVCRLHRGRRRSPGRTPRDGLHRLPQPRGAHLRHCGRRAQPGHGRGRNQPRPALGPQGGPGAAEGQLRHAGRGAGQDSSATRGLLSQRGIPR